MRLRIAILMLVSLLCGAVLAADKPQDVRDAMTASQFHATGLDKLTPQELAAFNAWLATYRAPSPIAASNDGSAQLPVPGVPSSAASLPSAQPDQHATGMLVNTPASPTPAPSAASVTNKFGQEMLSPEERGEPERIESRILGTFKGWNGRAVFKLENGQVWQQTDTGTYDVTLQDPQVVIKHLGLGYLLTLPGHGATVFVRRIH